jgi:WD40 repeat protein
MTTTNKNLFIPSIFIFIVITVIGYGYNHIIAGTTKLVDDAPELIKLEGHTGYVNSAVFSPDGKTIVTASGDKTVRIWDVATGKELKKFEGHTSYVNSAVFSPDGKTIVTASDDKTALIWDVTTGKVLQKIEEHTEMVRSATLSPDGKIPIFIASAENKLKEVKSAVFSLNSKTIVTASGDKTARIWDVATGKELKKLEGHTDGVLSAVFSPDSKTIVTASKDKTARIWDVVAGKESQKLGGHTDTVVSAVFSPNGKTIVTASRDKTARIWDVATGKELQKLEGHTNSVWSAVFSPDSKTILTTSDDNTARIWNATTGKELQKIEGHISSVHSAIFSPDGKTILMASDDNTARIRDWQKIQQRLQREEQAEKEQQAKNKAESLVSYYLKEAKFEENELGNFVQYGTKSLQDQFKNADEFDKAALKKQITDKQNEIRSKKYVLRLPYTTTNIEVSDTNASVELIVPLPLFVRGIFINGIKNNAPDTGVSKGGDTSLTNSVQRVFASEVGEYDTDKKLYGTRASFLKKDGTISACQPWEVPQILNNNGVIYWEETRYSILHILVSDKTETVKKMVRQKENYEVRISLSGLFWGHPKSHGWFRHFELGEAKSTRELRDFQDMVENGIIKGNFLYD